MAAATGDFFDAGHHVFAAAIDGGGSAQFLCQSQAAVVDVYGDDVGTADDFCRHNRTHAHRA